MELTINKPELRVFYCSDTHADFWRYSVGPFFDRVSPEDFDLFIFAGDVGEWKDDNCREMYDIILAWKKPIIMIPGNHEFYGREYHQVMEQLGEFAEKNPLFYFLEDNFVDLTEQKIRIWGSTFWTDFQGDPQAMSVAKRRMNDYAKIYFQRPTGGVMLEPADTVVMNDRARSALVEQTKDLPEDWRLVVVTHHAPFRESTPKKYRMPEYMEGARMNKAYVNDLYDWCERKGVYPNLWIHGHIHDRANYSVEWDNGKVCTVQSNPFGYPGEQNHDAIKEHYLTFSKNGVTVV
jgi:Calcineurin-like phosphoesterase.